MYKLFISQRDKNNANAIEFYFRIIEDSIRSIGAVVERVDNFDNINADDVVITLDAHSFFSVWRRNRKQRIINWSQGIAPEEMLFQSNGRPKEILRSYLWRLFEKIAISHASLCIFVSDRMRQHFQKKYGYKKDNFFVMPCFNQEIDESSFTDEKYQKPTFVYAGALATWQCFDETLDLYKKIKEAIPDALLYLYTGEQEKAKAMVEERGITDVTYDCVGYEEMQKVLSGKKYCFLIRQDMIINNVATPTKLNTYMAAGCIPIYSDVIDAFKDKLAPISYKIRYKGSAAQVIDSIKTLESRHISGAQVYAEYKRLFDDYYSRDKYVRELSAVLVKIFGRGKR